MSLGVVVALLLGSQQDKEFGWGSITQAHGVAAGGGESEDGRRAAGSRSRRSEALGCFELDGDVYLTASSNPFTCLDQVRLCPHPPVFYTRARRCVYA